MQRPMRVHIMTEEEEEEDEDTDVGGMDMTLPKKPPQSRSADGISMTEKDEQLIQTSPPFQLTPASEQRASRVVVRSVRHPRQATEEERPLALTAGDPVILSRPAARGMKVHILHEPSAVAPTSPLRVAVVCHVGNVAVFRDMVLHYPLFWNGPDVYLSCSWDEAEKEASRIVRPTKTFVTGNKGCDIGGFLLVYQYIKRSGLAENYDLVLQIHTKTDPVWRNGMLSPLHRFLGEIHREEKNGKSWVRSTRPLIFSGSQYVRKNYKLVNRDFVKQIVSRNFSKEVVAKIDELTDQYHCREFYHGEQGRSVFQGLEPNPIFYHFYEQDVKSTKHYELHGKHEFHRVSSYHYVKNFSRRNNNFVAGTCFAFNTSYLKILLQMNLANEISRLEPCYVKNTVPRRIHAWEYCFGLLSYLFNGDIVSTEDLRAVVSLSEDLVQRSAIRRPLTEARIAFLMIPPLEPASSGGYKTLLRYIRHLNETGQTVDIYFGIAWKDQDVYDNVASRAYYGEPSCKNWFKKPLSYYLKVLYSYGILERCRNNVYVGMRLNRKYDVLCCNAWQTAHAAYLNRHQVKKIAYVIQDREELFYPGDAGMQRRVLETYKPEWHYFCLSRYLTGYFRREYRLQHVAGSVLTYNPRVYHDKGGARKDGVVAAYYASKPGRVPWLMREVIRELLDNDIEVHVFPDRFEDHRVINHGLMDDRQLNDLYNQFKVGVVFSNTNPSRLGFEMAGSKLHVVELDSVYTKDDCPAPFFTLIHKASGVADIVRELFKRGSSASSFEEKHQASVEKKNLQGFFRGLLN